MSITLDLSDEIVAELREEAAQHGYTAEEWLAIQIRQRRAARTFRRREAQVQPLVEAEGWKSEEDIFRDVS